MDGSELKTNFETDRPASYFAEIFQKDNLQGGHVIKLGAGNDDAARQALAAYPAGLQVGGGINPENAAEWLRAGASHVIVTSYLFDSNGVFLPKRLDQLVAEVGRERLVIDLSCRAKAGEWGVVMNRWQNQTNLLVNSATIAELSDCCSEFLVHSADVEGKCEGIDERLVEFLGSHCPIPVTYAGGACSFEALATVDRLSGGKVDLTIGSALDLFGGMQVQYSDCVEWNQQS